MRRVKIITSLDIKDKFHCLSTTASDYEPVINESLAAIEKSGGKIIKIEYCISDKGCLESVIIEYETN